MDTPEPSDMVLVSRAELEELRQLKANLPTLLETARKEGGMDRLDILHAQQKTDPEGYRQKAKERYHRRKEQIRARRRELYRLKKNRILGEAGEAGEPGKEVDALIQSLSKL